MPTYMLCPTRTAKDTRINKAHAAPLYLFDAGKTSKMPSLVKWAKPTGEVRLIKASNAKPRYRNLKR